MLLFINTTDSNKTELALVSKEKIDKLEFVTNRDLSEKLLPQIQKLLKNKKIKLKDLTGIAVVKGPGSFMGIRTGVATGNTLAYVLNIPIFGIKQSQKMENLTKISEKSKKLGVFIKPLYNRSPGITKSTKSLF